MGFAVNLAATRQDAPPSPPLAVKAHLKMFVKFCHHGQAVGAGVTYDNNIVGFFYLGQRAVKTGTSRERQ